MTQPNIPNYVGPPPQVPPTSPRRSRAALVAAGVAVVAAAATGAALLVTAPWKDDASAAPPATSTVRHDSSSRPAAPQHGARSKVLDHRIVESDLYDNEGQIGPVCNGGEDIPAVTGRQFVCVTDTDVYIMRVATIAVSTYGSTVGWDLVLHHPRHAPPTGDVLHHAAVERFLVDLEDATAPVCNGGENVAAKTGKTFTCFEGPTTWTVKVTAIDADGGVHYELADRKN